MTESLAERATAKRKVTKCMNSVKQYVAEGDFVAADAAKNELKIVFKQFVTACENHESGVPVTDDKELDSCLKYFINVQDKYIDFLESLVINKPPIEEKSDMKELAALMSLPKVTIEPYDGDPGRYHTFMAIFLESVHAVINDDQMKLTRLLQYTTGKAKEAIRACALIGGSNGYKTARNILGERFGNDHRVAEHVIRDLREGKPVRSPDDVRQLADNMTTSLIILEETDMLSEVNNQQCLSDVANRLHPSVRNQWRKHALEWRRKNVEYPKFKELTDFITRIAEDLNDPVYGLTSSSDKTDNKYKKNVVANNAHAETHKFTGNSSMINKTFKYKCLMCDDRHRLWDCANFRAMKSVDRLKFVREHKLCENCLWGNHSTAECKKLSVCSIEGCGKKHTKFVHVDETNEVNIAVNNVKGENIIKSVSANVNFNDAQVYMPVVKVCVNGRQVNALLDQGSTNSFITEKMVNNLGLKGKSINCELKTLSSSEVKRSKMVSAHVISIDGSESLNMKSLFVTDYIPVVLPTNIDMKEHPHLWDVNFSNFRSNESVDLLIGQDNSAALMPIEVKSGRRHEPYAVRTIFGWCLNGPRTRNQQISQKVSSCFVSTGLFNNDTDDIWRTEEIASEKLGYSVEDKKVLVLWQNNCRKVNGHYEIPIPWKNNEILPNNVEMVHRRLKSLRKNLVRRNLLQKYDAEIVKLCKNGYAEEVPDQDLQNRGKTWYIPHQAVVTEKKPDKLRVVFDCAAQFEGSSLNDRCLQGPDLNNSLLGVLMRFRLNEIAVVADVEAMYNQVRIPIKDRDALRFLWINNDEEIKHYRMTSHLFGGVWCASSATFALRKTAIDAKADKLISETINRAFYVDDCLKSVTNEDEARNVMKGTKEVLSHGGFNLTKFVINSKKLMNEVPIHDRAKEVKDFISGVQSKALGISWDVIEDKFHFITRDIHATEMTRRKMLSFVSSTFDPLGLINPLILEGRLVLQDTARMKLNWDDNIPLIISQKWKSWVESLRRLNDMKIPRCVKPNQYNDGYIELHFFCDASEQAYGCCAYLRCVNKVGNLNTALLMSKSRVTPMKSTTIPRLELQAAVLAIKMNCSLREELDITVAKSTYWTDSEIVLRYIKNDRRRFHVYVANRVNLIHQCSEPEQWNHISGNENPADLLTRIQSAHKFDSCKWWWGPKFLRTYKSNWSIKEVGGEIPADDSEVKKREIIHAYLNDLKQEPCPVEQITKYFSTWHKAKRSVAWWLRIRNLLRGKVQLRKKKLQGHELSSAVSEVKRTAQSPLKAKDLIIAEDQIIKIIQQRFFKDEIKQIRGDKGCPKSSCLKSLNPHLGEDNILRVRGRLQHSALSENAKHPVIIPHKSTIAELIVKKFHNRAHLGDEWILSQIRNKYWITRARTIIKSVHRKCMICKKLFAKTCTQRMADLPEERIQRTTRPFVNVGIDCFGPFAVKCRRSSLKRYGCLYTCMVTRAIHIEKLDDLSTDSFLNSLRRFVARRGMPNYILTDNGTNFVGANRELNRSMKEVCESGNTQAYAAENDIEWRFNPPNASHMGGVWERMIRTVRKALIGVIQGSNRNLSDEALTTLLTEVENIVNSRPMTKISDDAADPEALTPNHLLMLTSGAKLSPGKFDINDIYKKQWRYVQHLSNVFWDKWTKLYLPELQRRRKWNTVNDNVKVGDLVLLEEATPRSLWPLGLVEKVMLGKDNLVRSVQVRTRSTRLVRPVTKVVLLEGE